MISIDRASAAPPRSFLRAARIAHEELAALVAQRPAHSKQSKLPFDDSVTALPDVVRALHKLFGGNCAFCETPLDERNPIQVACFRPRERAQGVHGDVDPLHYWWLAYDWDNLHASCKDCAHAKGSRFPVQGKRASRRDCKGASVRERPLLLDPCRDDPDVHIGFLPSGEVRSNSRRGRMTIDVFALNRPRLVKARFECYAVIESVCEFLIRKHSLHLDTTRFVRAVQREMRGNGFLALAREHALRFLEIAEHDRERKRVDVAPTRRAKRAPRAKVRIPATAAMASAPRAYHGAVWLRRVEIENYKALRHVVLEFPEATTDTKGPVARASSAPPQPTREPWLMLLGENGVGKSSVLKAIALAMMPAAQRSRYAARSREWVSDRARSGVGRIRLEFTVGSQPLELHFSRKTGQVVRKGEYPDVAVLGYGSTRLLPPASTRKAQPERVRVQNLFDSRSPLRDAERWLTSAKTVARRDFDLLATSLKALLSLREEDQVARKDEQLSATVFGGRVPIRELSDGYQSVLALALDMMLNLSKASFDMEGVEGVVLLDEIEVHLHPRWKLAIVEALRNLFPRVRFIATTHDPLCVHGLRPGELHVMTRQGPRHDVAIEQFDVPPGARADQILTGAWFGVPTTRDPETVAMMREHSQLLQKAVKSEAEASRFSVLDRELRSRVDEYVGTTDEQIALKAAADLRAEQRARQGAAGATSASDLHAKIMDVLRRAPREK